MNIPPAKSEACSKINTDSPRVSCTQEAGRTGIQPPPPVPPTCLLADHLSPSVLQGRKEKRETGEGARSPTRTTMQCRRKVRVNGANIPAMFSRALWPFLSETIHYQCFLNVEAPPLPQPPPPPHSPKPILTVKHGRGYRNTATPAEIKLPRPSCSALPLRITAVHEQTGQSCSSV